MRRRPLMNDIVMTINLLIIFIGCYLLFYLIGGIVEGKLVDILGNLIEKKESIYYYLYFGINSIVGFGVLFLAVIYGVKYTFKFFVCYQDDGEKVFKYSFIGLILILIYANYTMHDSLLYSLGEFDKEQLFIGTQALKDMWSSLQGNLEIVFLIINIIISICIGVWAYNNKKKLIDKCDFRI